MSNYHKSSWCRCSVSQAVFHMASWLNEAVSLGSNGVTSRQCTVHIEGPYGTIEHIWSKVKSTAAFYDAATRCVRNGEQPNATRKDLIDAFVETRGSHTDPEQLAHTVRHILSGTLVIQIPCTLGRISDFEDESQQMSSLLVGQSQAEWEKYRLSIVEGFLDDVDGVFKETQSLYADFPES
ncbi:hypothetical protein CC86DRAFT_165592 [Ophiobolus disseminans]|uniref:Uncharacterized protein n=1 Tax=Ophiobolus disseminans TaxID=1469910 RepID=A0A6A7ADB1_9PLEO|nr:hypothetical protein CC86DRAFT_165592 [Ophiobolus disseminans]